MYTTYDSPESRKDIEHRARNHPPLNTETIMRHQNVRSAVEEVMVDFDHLLPPGREKSLALTKLEEAMFWANAAVARSKSEEAVGT